MITRTIPLPLPRWIQLLPCAGCGLPGPHLFRMEREHGAAVLCRNCKPVEDRGEGNGDVLEVAHATKDVAA